MFLRDLKVFPYITTSNSSRKALFIQTFFTQEDPMDNNYFLKIGRKIGTSEPQEIALLDLAETYYYIDSLPAGVGVSSITYVVQLLKDRVPVYTQEVVPVTLKNKHQFLATRAFLSDYMKKLESKTGNGTEVLILKKKRWGNFCGTCGSNEVNSSTLHNCPACGGTGYVGGFYLPIRCFVDLMSLTHGQLYDGQVGGIRTEAMLQVQMQPYPLLEIGDVLYIEDENVVLGVDSVDAYDGPAGGTSLQIIRASKVNKFESPEFNFLSRRGIL